MNAESTTDEALSGADFATSLPEVRSIPEADIYKGTQLAATLVRGVDGVEFRYRGDYLDSNNDPICSTLPLAREPSITPSGAVPPFFAGLLPEGRRLSALRRAIKTSADDEFSLLLAVGADPIGDVAVVAQGMTPVHPSEIDSAQRDLQRPISELRFSDLLDEVGILDAVALPGVQDKASVKGLSLPVGHRDHQYILKVDPPEHPNIVVNEAYFLQLAQDAGLPTTKFNVVIDADHRPGLLVQRFDRLPQPDDVPFRLECEDACQLLGRWPADKYNLTTEQVAQALIERCDAKVIAARDVLRQLLFAWLTGNGDVHAKNLSVLRSPDGERKIAPAYDLPSTVPYGDLTLALTIGGKPNAISRKQWLELGALIGVREKAANRIIDDLLAATEPLIAELIAGLFDFNDAVVRSWTKQLRNRRQLLTSG